MASVAEKVDVVIVGAGAAGCVHAATLASAGKSVRVLEAGPAWQESDMVSSGVWSRRLRWGGPPVESTGANPAGVGFNTGWGFGGAALHHYGTWPRLHPTDFTMASDHGRGLDWPISYDDLRPFYDRVQADVGVSGDAKAEIWRGPGDPYPLPPLEMFTQARRLAAGFTALGMSVAPSPMAILSQDYKGRSACIYDGWCDAGCPIGSLANPLVTYMPVARAAGARFDAGAYVTRVLVDDATGRASGVEYLDAQGETHVQPADLVILAASTIHNPALLLNSVSARWPQGLANRSGLVGAYFMTHSISQVFGFFDDEETEVYLGVTGAQMINMDDHDKTSFGDGAFGSLQWLIAPTMKPNDLLGVAVSRADLFGAPLEAFMQRAVHHMAVMFGFGEDLPQRTNRIELTDRAGPGGTRLPRVVHAFDADGLGVAQKATAKGLEVLNAAGAADPWAGPMASAHLIGGTIMGQDAATAVTDSYGRCHEVENLVIAGPGLFPTSGSANPNFTNHAVTLRSAEHIATNWGSYSG